MYIQNTPVYYRGSQQTSQRGPFLLLLQPNQATISTSCSPENTFAVVRQVALKQMGPWMMGRANIQGKWHVISGGYGNDGLPMSIDTLPKDAVPLPRNLYDLWVKGEGWNGPGSEASALRKWAIETFLNTKKVMKSCR